MSTRAPTYATSAHTEKKQDDLVAYGGNMLQTAGCIVSRWGGRPTFIDLSAGYGVDPQGKLSGCIHLMDLLLASYPLDVYLCEANSERADVLRQTVLARYGPHLQSGRLRAWVHAMESTRAFAHIAASLAERAASKPGSVYGLAYADPCRPSDIDWRPIYDLATRFRHLDVLTHLPCSAAKRAARAHARPGLEVAFDSMNRLRERMFVQEPDGAAQWSFAMWTNFREWAHNHKRRIYDASSERGQRIVDVLISTHEERRLRLAAPEPDGLITLPLVSRRSVGRSNDEPQTC